MKYLALFCCLIYTMHLSSYARAAEPARGADAAWQRLPELPQALSGRFAGVSGGALIVAGGSGFTASLYEGGKKFFSDRIDVRESPNGGTWKSDFHLERPIAQGASVTTDDGLLCIGGGDADRNYASVVRLRWTGSRVETDRLPDLPSPSAFSGAARIGSLVYVVGGSNAPTATEALHTFWRIDLKAKAPVWEALPPWPGPARIGAAVVAQGDAVYVISGASLHTGADGKPARTYLQDAYRYRPGEVWKRIADTPGPVVAAPAFAGSKGSVVVFGGDSGADAARAAELKDRHPGFRRDILTYDPANDRWTSQPNALPIGLVTTNAVCWGDSVVLPGGEDRPGHRSTAVLSMRDTNELGSSTLTIAQPTQTPVYVAGADGYHTYRIPSLLTTKSGVLLAFAEGRRNGAGDAGAVDLLLKRSTDGGKTWGQQQLLWADADNTCGNPCPVVDEATGTICLLTTHNLGQDHEKQIIDGTSVGKRTVWILRSMDEGVTWSKPEEITATVKQPDWGWYATGPGVGIQIQNGRHKGRLVVPCDHSEPPLKHWRSHVIFSDDGGKTWKLGGGSPRDDTNESQMAEIADGRLILNMRSADPTHKRRSVCFSTDGGESWTDFRYDEALIEPICQASLIGYPGGSGRLLFANPASETARQDLTVRLSRDGGQTWPVSRTLYPGPSAYSCLALLPGAGGIGCLYERGEAKPYDGIMFAAFSDGWLQGDHAVR